MANRMEETLKKETPPLEVKVSEEGGIRLRLRDRDLLKKRKAEAEEKATNQWVYGAQSIKRPRKSGTPGRKGRPRKQLPITQAEDEFVARETDSPPVTLLNTLPVLTTAAETVTLQPAEPQPVLLPVETLGEKSLEGFLIEDLGPDEEEDMPQKRLVIDTGDDEQCVDESDQSKVSIPEFAPAPAPPQAEYLPEPLI